MTWRAWPLSHLRMARGSVDAEAEVEDDNKYPPFFDELLPPGNNSDEEEESSVPIPPVALVVVADKVAAMVDAFAFVLFSVSAELVVKTAFWMEREAGRPRGDCLSLVTGE